MRYRGLSAKEVADARRAHGTNALERGARTSFWRRFLAGLGDPIIRILLLALLLNVILLFGDGNLFETIGIALAILVSTLVSTCSEYSSDRAFARLQNAAASTRVRVMRDGHLTELSPDALVVGDIVLLSAGERVPADGRLREGVLSVDQSALNGESEEVEKRPGAATHTWELGAPQLLFRGSLVTAGNGVFEVGRVGAATFYGGMAAGLSAPEREGPLRVKLSHLAKTLSRIGYLAAVLVALADLANAVLRAGVGALTPQYLLANLLHAVTLGLTVVVVAVPEGLPMMITVVLSSNMVRMQKNGVMVRKLTGIETAGGVDMLFTDKTGTLTRGKPEIVSLFAGGAEGSSLRRLAAPLRRELALCALAVNESVWERGRAIGGNTTDRALLSAWNGERGNLPPWETLATTPFDSTRKCAEATIACDGQTKTYHKGAPEQLLLRCTFMLDAQGMRQPLARVEANRALSAMTGEGMRVLALCRADNDGMVLLGLVGMRDRLRREARGAVETLHKAGVQVVMVTGDNPDTAAVIARAAGILSDDGAESILTGAALAAMTDAEISAVLPHLRVIARALPTDKSRLVRIAEEMGRVVGMTGDGLNDAPALKSADVGFAMGSGTEVAKEAGDIVILDDNISSIVRAVLYGRTVFANIRKFIVFQLTMNLCAVGVSVLAPFFGIDAPVTVMQMLWVNLMMDTLAGLAFAGEAALPAYLRRPPLARNAPVLSAHMVGQICTMGVCTVVLCMFFLLSPQVTARYPDTTHHLTAFFTLFIFCGILNCINARTESLFPLAGISENPTFVVVLLLVSAVQIGMVYFGGTLFRCTPLDRTELLAALTPALLVLPIDFMRKLFCRLTPKKRKF